MTWTTLAIIAVAAVSVALVVRYLFTSVRYPEVDLSEVDVAELMRAGERLLEQAEGWRTELADGSVAVATSLAPFVVRAVHYRVEADSDLETAIAYVKNLSDCGETSREGPEKFEETLYDKDRGGSHHRWVRRSVHLSPPPGKSRDATVAYFEDRPDPKTYRISFRSVHRIDGKPIPPFEGAKRFTVHPALYKLEELAPGRVRVRKVEAVDPQGLVGPLLNNYFIAPFFFRRYMFDEARAMRDALEGAQASGVRGS